VKLTVLTWLWAQPGGRARFDATNVNIWFESLLRNSTLDLDIACVTDIPEGIDPRVRIIDPPGEWEGLQTSRWKGGRPSCYRRIAMFRPDAADIFGERFVCMDLDCVITDNIDRILDRDEDFVICEPSQKGVRWVYNGSMVMMTAGCRPRVYNQFTPDNAELASRRFVGSDQAWIAYVLGPGEALFTREDGVTRWGEPTRGPIVFFPGNVKPWDCLGVDWVAEHYRLGEGRRGIILGERRSVWSDAEKAEGPFDSVIALPATAMRWPHRVDAIARDVPHAMALARMLGVDQPVLCGA
jgi:hypothetical protein